MPTKQKNSKKTTSKSTGHHTRAVLRAKKILLPNKANDYRPHLIRARGIIAVLVVALLAQLTYGWVTTGKMAVLGRSSSIQTSELADYTNKARSDAGLPELRINDELSKAASLKVMDMFEAQYWAHVSPSGVQPWKWFADAGYSYSVAGENLAKDYPTAQATVNAWLDSPTHRANLLNKDYVDVGYAVMDGDLDGENTTLIVAMYGAPAIKSVGAAAESSLAAFSAPVVTATSGGLWAHFKNSLASLSPVTIGVLLLFGLVALVGALAHRYRRQLPKSWQKNWRRHHGMYAFFGMIALGVLVILATNSGSI